MGGSEYKKQVIDDTPVVISERREKKEPCRTCCKFTAYFLIIWIMSCALASIFIDELGTTIIYVKYNDLSDRLGSLKSYYSSDADNTYDEYLDNPQIKADHKEAVDKTPSATALTQAPANLLEEHSAEKPLNVAQLKSPETREALKPLTVEVVDSTFFLPWYFREGERRPPSARRIKKTGKRVARIFPAEDAFIDRITNQLMFVPPEYETVVNSGARKTILLYDGLEAWNLSAGGNAYFKENECPVFTCDISTNREDAEKADLLLFKDHYEPIHAKRSTDQVYGFYWRDSPPYSNLTDTNNVFNWTATYRMDSTLVEPFKKWELFDRRNNLKKTNTNYAAGKSRKVAWYIDECVSYNDRIRFALELKNYIQVDIYGPCGFLECPNNDPNECSKLFANEYKFYLAFEKANCRDYITDVFYTNLIDRNILPVVMGAHPEDYENRAPHRSYLHVDNFKSVKELANYLNVLDNNDKLYNHFFEWKGTGEFIDTKFLCRACALLHDDYYFKSGWKSSVRDLTSWWNGPGTCTNTNWKEDSAHHSAADAACEPRKRLFGNDTN